ncbi:exopolysaccharide biosynthesis protein [Aurantiacibacter gangjinensis]|uniref:exopolysaccharide biosynthesis protein n=1 Tax=Aurantiacibacter gangjinensis TaxID=502682 RepID=UPI0007EDA7A4|nr:exopolysaccharide biosynthesis protein [Aurantiacibacter gangjinensis]APE27582.1 Exopolysaccharide synthesis, ExoD [Aurantiacibacter gangjinensis]
MSRAPQKVGDILDRLEELAKDQDDVTVGRIVNTFGPRTFGPAIMLPAMLEITPLGAVPGMPTVLAVIILLVAAQKMLGRTCLWLPGIITNRTIGDETLAKSTSKLRGIAGWLDRHFHRRWMFMTQTPFSQIAAGIVVLLCLIVPFLEVLPFASSVPMIAIAGFGLAVLVRDGVLMAFALAISLVLAGLGLDFSDGNLSDTDAADGVITEDMMRDEPRDLPRDLGEAVDQRTRAPEE